MLRTDQKYAYALLYNDYEINPCMRISFSTCSLVTVGMPLFAFFFCVTYSVLFHFTSATYTHCQVKNVLPSISAAIGNFSPQREIWQVAILLHSFPRFYVVYLYYFYHQKKLYPRDYYLGSMACLFSVIENLALLILSFWTSSQYYPIHKNAFVTFIVMSECYMIVSCLIQARHRSVDRRTLKIKRRLLLVNIACIFIAGYFFIRHNTLCEEYVYSLFALAEYIVVLTNMAFHMTAYFDFRDKDFVLYRYGIALCER